MRILVAGNCQAAVIGHAIRIAAEITGDAVDCRFFETIAGQRVFPDPPATLRELLAGSDVVIWQLGHGETGDLSAIVPDNALTITFPVVGMHWLWPFATQAHPANCRMPPHLPWGPFPPDLGDALLNSLLARHDDPDTALAAFDRIDPVAQTNLDRLFALTRDMTVALEASADVRIWPLIAARFRHERLFWDRGHPSWALFEPVCREILRRLPWRLSASVLDVVAYRIGETQPNAGTQAPIHPRVAEYFALAWWRPGMRYRQGVAGWFTHEEYLRRYAWFDVDFHAYRAAHLTRTGKALDIAEQMLRAAMTRAPDNAELSHALALNLWKQRQPGEAAMHATRAARDPCTSLDDRVHRLRCAALWDLEEYEGVVAAAREAIEISRHPAGHYHLLGCALARLGHAEEAAAASRTAMGHDPFMAEYNPASRRRVALAGSDDRAFGDR